MTDYKHYEIGNDVHYKKAVARLGDSHEIVSHEVIYTEHGQTLLPKGSRINSAVYEKLIKHKLQQPLGDSVSVDTAVTTEQISHEITQLLTTSRSLSSLMKSVSSEYSIQGLLGHHQFPPNIALKLTVTKTQRPDIYAHLLLVASLAFYIACRSQLPSQALTQTLFAGLFHDLGMLHLDPALFEPGHLMTGEERNFIHVHVIVSYLMLEPYAQYQPEVSRAVLEHHERLDGSGYPKGKPGKEISLIGQILAVAEVVASKLDQQGNCTHPSELELLFNMNLRKLNRQFFSYFSPLFMTEQDSTSPCGSPESDQLLGEIRQLANIIHSWPQVVLQQPSWSVTTFISTYVDALVESLVMAGINLDNVDILTDMLEQDATIRCSAYMLMKESAWQLKNLLEELKRRKLYLQGIEQKHLGSWLDEVTTFINTMSPHVENVQ